jgi:hypothetical protein
MKKKDSRSVTEFMLIVGAPTQWVSAWPKPRSYAQWLDDNLLNIAKISNK